MTAAPVRVTACIVSWNVRDDLEACLSSLAVAAPSAPIETIVVDNASTDDTVDVLRKQFPDVKLILNTGNRGFAAATNQGMEAAKGDLLLLLNPDTVLPEHAVDDLVAFADAHPEAGIIAPKLLNADGSLQHSCRRFPTVGAAVFRHTIFGRLFPRNRWAAEYVMDDWDHDSEREVDWVSGACMLVRRELYEEIGPLDEGYFWGSEDVDYCYRAHAAGSKVLYAPRPAITHKIGSSSSQMPVRTVINFHRSTLRLFRKHIARNVFEYGFASAGIVLRAALLIVQWWLQVVWACASRPFRKSPTAKVSD